MILSNQPSEQKTPQLVKPNPLRKTQLNRGIIVAIISLQMVVFVIWDLLERIKSGTEVPLFYWFYLIGLLFIIALQVPSRKERRAWKRHEQCRQLAAQGNREQVFLATVQPILDVSAVPLPIIVYARNRFSTVFSLFALLLILVISALLPVGEFIVFSTTLDLSIGHISITPFLLTVFIPLEFLLLFCTSNWISAMHHDSQQLEFTEAGFRRCTGKNAEVVPWEDARLFALIPVSPDLRKTSSPFTAYELASANEVLHWSTVKHKVLFAGQSPPTLQERRQQMQILLSVIAAKTNLPLYDLR